MAGPNRSFWPESERTPFDTHLYDVLRHGPYAALEHSVIIHLEARSYKVPPGLGLWDGLVDGFRVGILDIQVAPVPTVNTARQLELEERYGQEFSADIYRKVYIYAHAIGFMDARWVRQRVRHIGRTPLPRLSELLRSRYYYEKVSRSSYTDDALPIPVFEKRLGEIEETVLDLLSGDNLR